MHIGTWSGLLEGQLSVAVEALDFMVHRSVHVTDSVFYGILKRCIAMKDLVLGSHVHSLAVRSGYESNAFLANHIICMYASHGKLEEATLVFGRVPTPSRHMWASIILAHARHGLPKVAIDLYRRMRESPVKPDNHIFAAVLTACATLEDLSTGRDVHADISSNGKLNVYVGSSLVDMYSKCGSLEDARTVFDSLTSKDVVIWNAMLSGYAQHGHGQEALTLYKSMEKEGVSAPDAVTFVCLLKACAKMGALKLGEQVHQQIQERGLEVDVVVHNCLVNMYAKCGNLKVARRIFDTVEKKDVVTWTSMIAGYAQHGHAKEVHALYDAMVKADVGPFDAVAFGCLLQSCACIKALHLGKQLHAQVRTQGLETDVCISTCLVDLYLKCESLDDAREVFFNLPSKNVKTWAAMIAGYSLHGLSQEALTLYEDLKKEAIPLADALTAVCLLQACASIRSLQEGRKLHEQIQARGLEAVLYVGNCVVTMYAKCGSLQDARQVFDNLPTKDVVTWNAMIAAYTQHGLGEEALALYRSMQQQGITPADAITFVCLLQACSSVAGIERGKEVHAEISRNGFETSDVVVANALIDMYAKLGSMADAQQVFDALLARDIVTWTTLIDGYSRQGESELVFHLFERLIKEGLQPNHVTFLSVLTVCSHGGLVDKGQHYFESMSSSYGINPTVEHYGCIIDLLGRAGQVERAMKVLQTMPFQAPMEVWRSLLGACQKWKKVELGREAFEGAVRLDVNDAAVYMLMANIYKAAQMPQEANSIEALRVIAGAWKDPGQTRWRDDSGCLHTFAVRDVEHNERQRIYAKLKKVSARMEEDMYSAGFQ